jgi:hypothetical protein
MPTLLTDLTTIGELAQHSGLPERLLKYWVNQNVAGFRDRCTLRVEGRRLIDLAAASNWLEQWRSRGESETLGSQPAEVSRSVADL